MAYQMGTLISFLPAFLLSGFIYSISNMPRVIQFIALFVPARYFINISKGVFLKGIGLRILWPDFLLLCGYGASCFLSQPQTAAEGGLIMRQRLRCIIRKEFIQALRDPRMRGMLLMPPLIQLLIFGYAVNLDVDTAEHRLDGSGPHAGEPRSAAPNSRARGDSSSRRLRETTPDAGSAGPRTGGRRGPRAARFRARCRPRPAHQRAGAVGRNEFEYGVAGLRIMRARRSRRYSRGDARQRSASARAWSPAL